MHRSLDFGLTHEVPQIRAPQHRALVYGGRGRVYEVQHVVGRVHVVGNARDRNDGVKVDGHPLVVPAALEPVGNLVRDFKGALLVDRRLEQGILRGGGPVDSVPRHNRPNVLRHDGHHVLPRPRRTVDAGEGIGVRDAHDDHVCLRTGADKRIEVRFQRIAVVHAGL